MVISDTYVGIVPVITFPAKSPVIPLFKKVPIILTGRIAPVFVIIPDNVSIPLELISAVMLPFIVPDTVPINVV